MQVDLKILDSRLDKDMLPAYSTSSSAGLDLRACIGQEIILKPNDTTLVPSGIAIFIKDPNFCGMLLPRSGLGHKYGIVLGNLVGLIDADYQGQLLVSLWNRSKEEYIIKPLERIAQLVIVPVMQVEFNIIQGDFNLTSRGAKGFGSTGKD